MSEQGTGTLLAVHQAVGGGHKVVDLGVPWEPSPSSSQHFNSAEHSYSVETVLEIAWLPLVIIGTKGSLALQITPALSSVKCSFGLARRAAP